MITGCIFPYLIFVFKLLSSGGLSPYEWEPGRNRFRHAIGIKWYTWRIWHVIVFCKFCFVLWRWITFLLHPENYELPIIEKAIFVYYLTSYLLSDVTSLSCTNSKVNERLQLINNLIIFETKMKGKTNNFRYEQLVHISDYSAIFIMAYGKLAKII